MRNMGTIKVRATGSPVPSLFGGAITGEINVPDVAYYGRRILSGELERVAVAEVPEPIQVAAKIAKKLLDK